MIQWILESIRLQKNMISGVAIIFSALIILIALSGFIFFIHRHRKAVSPDAKKLAGVLASKDVQSEILIESITDGIIVVDNDCKISLINNAAAKMANWPVKEATGFDAKVILRLLADEKATDLIGDQEHPFTYVLKQRQRYQKTLILVDRANNRSYISLVISPVILPEKNEVAGAVAVFRDVSAEKTEEQQRSEFVSTASHEMRTPVAAIEGYLALALNENASTIDTRARNYLEKAHASTQHLGKLFQDLLTSAKAEDGRLVSHPEIVEMNGFIEQLSEDLKFAAEKKGLTVEFIVNTHATTESGAIDTSAGGGKVIQPLYYVKVDPDRIREVITNVFDNAVKYTEQGKVSLGLTGNNEVVQVRIADTGPGIPADDLPHLFQKFYRVDNSATRQIGGTGLGLFICKKIIELYNGTIWAESKMGEGSTFYINLPRIETSRAEQLKSQQNTTP